MNRKGFTLIELLAVVVLLGVVLAISSGVIINVYNASLERNEEVFVDSLKKNIDTYISLYGSTVLFDKSNKDILVKKSTGDVYAYKSVNSYKVSVLVDKEIVDKVVNPRNGLSCYDDSFDLYVDDDYVYCFKMNLSCLVSNKDINTCSF